MQRSAFLLSVMVAVAAPHLAAAAPDGVDLELVLAVDVSGSMDAEERALQRNGYAAAFRHPEVIAAIASGPLRRIVVTYVEWAGSDDQEVVVPWTILASPEDAFALADMIAETETLRENGTSISDGLEFASGLFASSGVAGLRRVIDVSGDGPNNVGLPVASVRDRVAAEGITINGLAILPGPSVRSSPYEIAELDIYYEQCVIGGPGAFIVTVDNMSQFPAAIRRKLVLEIAGVAPDARLIPVSLVEPRIDCLIGEQKLERFLSSFPSRGI
jgi:hypothetical protein